MDGVTVRSARSEDLPALVRLLANDPLGATRERPTQEPSERYLRAFAAIDADPAHELLVAEVGRVVCGCLQLSFLPHLTYEGGWRAQVEGVRVDPSVRGRGIGRLLFNEVIARARARGCHLVQLTTDARRPEALAFYEALGFQHTHHGMKLHLGEEPRA